MFTAEGVYLTLGLLAERLKGGQLRVLGPDEHNAAAAIETVEFNAEGVVVSATFPADFANFEWRAREVVTTDGTVIDRQEEDLGRKAPGAEWTLEAVIELAPETG